MTDVTSFLLGMLFVLVPSGLVVAYLMFKAEDE